MTVTPSNQNVNSIANSTPFNVTANATWSATSDQTWCTLSNAGGNGNRTITANFTANNTTGTRIANIVITGNGAPSQTVTQANFVGTKSYFPFQRQFF